MKKFFFVGFFFSYLYVFSQTEEEDAILDSVIDQFFSTDSLLVDLPKTNYLYTNFSFDESVFFAGRDFDINQFGFTPSISYMRGQNFFVSLGSAYFSELDPKWDFVSISSGYSLFLDQNEKLSLTGIYSRIFFADDTACFLLKLKPCKNYCMQSKHTAPDTVSRLTRLNVSTCI